MVRPHIFGWRWRSIFSFETRSFMQVLRFTKFSIILNGLIRLHDGWKETRLSLWKGLLHVSGWEFMTRTLGRWHTQWNKGVNARGIPLECEDLPYLPLKADMGMFSLD